jgi:trehalose 6-phosphate phosphatase
MTSPDPLPRLVEPLVADPANAAVLTDFDGTLSRIVDRPGDARPLEGARDVLGALAQAFGRVGVISGRPAVFLREHLGAPHVRLVGLYGLEWIDDDGGVVTHPDAAPWRDVVDGVVANARDHGPDGVLVEHKPLSVTFHYRENPDREAAARSWAEADAARTGLVSHPARMSYELRPPVDRDKGTAVEEQAAGLGAACFVGDDRGDLAAFDALDRLRAKDVDTLRVAVRSAEAPAELLERADVLVDGPGGALDLLRSLADAVSRASRQ